MTIPPPSGSDRVVEYPHFAVTLRQDGIVWLRRRGEPYASLAELHAAYDQFLSLVDEWLFDRRIKSGAIGTRAQVPMGWLYDVREAPSQRNDPAFEEAIRARRADLLQRSPLLVILTATTSGRFQIERMAREARTNLEVHSNFDEAVAFLHHRMSDAFRTR